MSKKTIQKSLAFLLVALAFAVQSSLALLVPLYGLTLGASPALVGLLVSSAFLLPLFLGVPIGLLLDRWGSRSFLILGSIGIFAATLYPLFWLSVGALVLLQLAIGLFHLLLVLATQSFVAALSTIESRPRDFGWLTSFQSLGQFLGPLSAGALLDSMGYISAFIATAVFASVIPLLALAIKLDKRRISQNNIRLFTHLKRPPEMFSNVGFKLALYSSSAIFIALSAHQTLLPIYLDEADLPASLIGALLAVRALASLVIRPFIPLLLKRVRNRILLILLLILLVAKATAFIGLTESPFLLSFLSVILGMGSGVVLPLSIIVIADHVVESQRGLALGFRMSSNRLAQFLSPLILGGAAEVVNVAAAFGLCALMLLLVGGAVLKLSARYRSVETKLGASSIQEKDAN
jgi:MFS family permease